MRPHRFNPSQSGHRSTRETSAHEADAEQRDGVLLEAHRPAHQADRAQEAPERAGVLLDFLAEDGEREAHGSDPSLTTSVSQG